uniref:FYVE-type domain-containing protein n=1 Tax=Haptolina ericina TaxID=156174 RepID=A0A7S3B5X1_9EUKA
MADDSSDSCTLCGMRFNLINRRHHCRACGRLTCHACAPRRRLPESWLGPRMHGGGSGRGGGGGSSYAEPARACDECVRRAAADVAQQGVMIETWVRKPPAVQDAVLSNPARE